MAGASQRMDFAELRTLLEDKESFYNTVLSDVSSLLESWQKTMRDARRRLENVQRQGQISCQQKAPGDIRPAILQGFTVNIVAVRRQAKTVNDLLHLIDRIQQENKESDEVNEIMKAAAQIRNYSDVDCLMDRVQKYYISRSQQCFSVTEAYVKDFGRAAKMLFEDMQKQLEIVEDFMKKHDSVAMASQFMKVNRGVFDRLMQIIADENGSYPQPCKKATQLQSGSVSSNRTSNLAGDDSSIPDLQLLKLDQLHSIRGDCDLYQPPSSVKVPTMNTDNNRRIAPRTESSDWDSSTDDEQVDEKPKATNMNKPIQRKAGQGSMGTTQSIKDQNNDGIANTLTQSANKSSVDQSAQHSDWDSSNSEQETAVPIAPTIMKAIQRNGGRDKRDTNQCIKHCKADVIAKDISRCSAETTTINTATTSPPGQATQLSDWDANSSDETQHVTSLPRKRMVKNMINPSINTLKEIVKRCGSGNISNALTESAKKGKRIATTNTTPGHSTRLSDWGSSSESSTDEGNVASIAPISKKEIIQSYKCQRKMKLKESTQSSTNEDLTNGASERTKRFVQNYAATQSKLSQSKHILDFDCSDSEDDMTGVRTGTVPMKTQIQNNSSHGNMKLKVTGNNSTSSIDRDNLVRQMSHITPTKKTVNHHNATKLTTRINNSSVITTPDGQTKYGPDGLTPNGMNRKQIEKMDQLFCVEKKPGGVQDQADSKRNARQSNHNDEASIRRVNTLDPKSSAKKHKNSNVYAEKEKSGSHGIIGKITSALGDHIPMNKGNKRRDDDNDSADAHEERIKSKGHKTRDKDTRKNNKSKKAESYSRVFYPKDYAPVAQDCYPRDPSDEPDEYSTPITDQVTADKVPRTIRSGHHMDMLTKELDLTAARATNIRVLATRDWRATAPNEIGLRKGTIVKQKRAMNSQGMAFGWKKTRYGIKKHGYFPSAAVILYPTEENYDRLGLPFPPSLQ